jgi:transposase-like protein
MASALVKTCADAILPKGHNETYIKVEGQWRYLYRGVDKQCQTIDFLLSKNRDKAAAARFFKKAISRRRID